MMTNLDRVVTNLGWRDFRGACVKAMRRDLVVEMSAFMRLVAWALAQTGVDWRRERLREEMDMEDSDGR